MKQAMVVYTQHKKHDHFDTPACAVYPILPFIKPEWVIWEPTDTYGRSEITRLLKEHGNTVISTSIKEKDFLLGTPDFNFDCIVTNPPYSLKNEFIGKCYSLKKRWAMLLPITALEGKERGQIYKNNGIELLVLDRRVNFTKNQVWFNSSWFCHGVLPEKLMFTELKAAG